MPIVRNTIAGAALIASAKVARKFVLTVQPGTTSARADAQLQVNTLPLCTFSCIMVSGPTGCSFQPLWAVDNESSGGVIVPAWQPVTIAQAVHVGVPFVLTVRLAANMISGVFSVPASASVPAQVKIILAASQ